MIVEFGHYALILALMLAVLQAIVPLLGVHTQKKPLMQMARSLAYGQCVFIALAFTALAFAFLSNDFSVAYVADNSNSQLPWFYRFCAIWGAHEGSLLLWVFILSLWMGAVAFFSQHLPLPTIARVLAVLAMISIGFLLFLLTTSSPFIRWLPNFPIDGQDLNPLLQDPGLVSHPPMLYMGYVGFSVAFAFAIAALLEGRLDATWARWAKPWTLLAWCFLTCGIVLGSWWAYRELGWGGWWFWDPVENASLLPWLVGTALIHSLVVTAKRDTFKAWTALLAIFTFSLSLLGTFLVRSGVLISVHSFAADPLRGEFMLIFLAVVVGGSLLLYALRAGTLSHRVRYGFWARENLLLLNNLLLTAAMLTVLLGTLYPLIVQSLGWGTLSVGPPYFNTVFIPFMVCILFFMGCAPLSRWGQTEGRVLLRQLWVVFVASILLAITLPWLCAQHLNFGAVIGVGLALWVILATLHSIWQRRGRLNLSQWGMVLAHVGIAVTTLGIVLVSHDSLQRELRMSPGDTARLGAYTFQFLGVRPLQGANYTGVEGGVLVKAQQKTLGVLIPEQRIYTVQKTAISKTAMDVNPWRDLYVALGEPLEQNAWSLRIYVKPFVRWIWFGGLMTAAGGLLALLHRSRFRLKRAD
ncbi:MAG: heme lyase CcmF/NrfE family subunit [Gammaproteobacteria bacterium]